MKEVLAGVVAFVVTLSATAWTLQPQAEVVPAFGRIPEEALLRELGASRPEWRVGDAWQVLIPRSGFTCTLVVVEVGPEGYRQGASCPEAEQLMAHEAVFDLPYVGDFGRELQGDHEGHTTRYYSWPLTDGKRWETRWGDLDVEVEATFVEELEGPRGIEQGFRLRMTHDGDTVLAYDYIPSIRWWGSVRLPNGLSVLVASYQPGWSGEAVATTAHTRLELATGPGPVSATFVGKAEDDLLMLVRATKGTDFMRIDVRDPEGRSAYQETRVPYLFGNRDMVAFLEAKEGVWRVDAVHTGPGSTTLHVHALDVSYYSL